MNSSRHIVSGLLLAMAYLGPQDYTSAQQIDSQKSVRIATFNCSLNRDKAGELLKDLSGGTNKQAQKVARVLRTVRPDIVLLN